MQLDDFSRRGYCDGGSQSLSKLLSGNLYPPAGKRSCGCIEDIQNTQTARKNKNMREQKRGTGTRSSHDLNPQPTKTPAEAG